MIRVTRCPLCGVATLFDDYCQRHVLCRSCHRKVKAAAQSAIRKIATNLRRMPDAADCLHQIHSH